ncbi:MAG TPA: hypothetical protein PL009_11350 [Flavipsychrobacter sp.]|nr:hypothetical protein [Flavipsychrobacter sp.]
MRLINKISLAFIVVLLVMSTINSYAQDPGDPGGDVDNVPIDGGVSLLIAAGVGYGAKKLRDARKKKES